MPKTTTVATVATTLLLGLSACGGSSGTSTRSSAASSAPPTSTASTTSTPAKNTAGALTIAADPSGQLRFTKTSLSAKAGRVAIQFTNASSLAHNLMIQQGSAGRIVGGTPTFQGGSRTLTLNLKPGTYTFFCSVPGHRQAGMQGTLTVR